MCAKCSQFSLPSTYCEAKNDCFKIKTVLGRNSKVYEESIEKKQIFSICTYLVKNNHCN